MNSITLLCSLGISTILALSILGLVNLFDDSNIMNDQKNVRVMLQNNDYSSGNIKILNQGMVKPVFSNWIVKGKIKNTGSSIIKTTIISANFYDKESKLLNSSSLSLNNLNSGETRDFEMEYNGKIDPDSYKLELKNYI
ncbi:FxLYD domain-containing protein [Methanobacterium sp. ACI-7]|uniref:FxLYD domain-containing protein n=1 Tax=unclassified Methanobacterium TaxID=2627676 RepID=UPI0039C32E1B